MQKELSYLVEKNKESVNFHFERYRMDCLFSAIARALIRNPKILLLDEGSIILSVTSDDYLWFLSSNKCFG